MASQGKQYELSSPASEAPGTIFDSYNKFTILCYSAATVTTLLNEALDKAYERGIEAGRAEVQKEIIDEAIRSKNG